MKKKLILLAVIVLSLLALQAKPRKKTLANLPLHNTKWILEQIDDAPIFFSNSDTAYIVFAKNYTFHGNFGCNNYVGEYSFGKKRMKLDYLGTTKKMCPNMEVEERFFKAIKSDITHYYIEKNYLYLLYKLKVVCKFRADN